MPKPLRRVGRRGASLLFLALLDVVYAFSLVRPQVESERSPTLRYIADLVPLWTWAGLWLSVGVACLIGAFAHRDRWAFTVAVGLKILWGSTFLFGWLVGGLERGYLSAVVWLAFAALFYLISTWPEGTVVSPDDGDTHDR